jgi:hypothetical protein
MTTTADQRSQNRIPVPVPLVLLTIGLLPAWKRPVRVTRERLIDWQ